VQYPKLNLNVYNYPTDKHSAPVRRPHKLARNATGAGQSGLEDAYGTEVPSASEIRCCRVVFNASSECRITRRRRASRLLHPHNRIEWLSVGLEGSPASVTVQRGNEPCQTQITRGLYVRSRSDFEVLEPRGYDPTEVPLPLRVWLRGFRRC